MTSTFRQMARAGLCALGLAAAASTAAAHHSQSQFDPDKTVTIEGTLTRLSWRNPHTLFLVQARPVEGAASDQEWAVEGPSPQQLTKVGWGSAVSKVGDRVRFVGRPRRDGKPELLLLGVTLADGTAYKFIPD